MLTNAHVVADADEVIVKLTDQREYRAKVLGSDTATDVAVLKIEAKNLPVVKLGDPAGTRVGDWVVAIGTPYGLDNTVTSGIVSAKSRSLPGDGVVPFIQTDAAVNPGNSGGPLFNLNGEVVGINSQIFSRSGGFQGVAFAIPIDVAMNVADQIRTTGKVAHGRLGVTVQPVDQALADNFGLSGPRGALVGSVQKDSPAAKAGIEAGDVIVDVRRQGRSSARATCRTASPRRSRARRSRSRCGATARPATLNVEIGTREAAKTLAQADDEGVPKGKLGVSVRPLVAGREEGRRRRTRRRRRAGRRRGGEGRRARRRRDRLGQPQAGQLAGGAEGRDRQGRQDVALLIQRDDAQIFVPVTIG